MKYAFIQSQTAHFPVRRMCEVLENFTAQTPNQKWVSEITYIGSQEGWLYLAVIIDLYSRMVVGYARVHASTNSGSALRYGWRLFRCKFPRSGIVHSDRGRQYCSHDYQALLHDHGLLCSMSKRGDCYDNAAMESWNHSLKVELVHDEHYPTRRDAQWTTPTFSDTLKQRQSVYEVFYGKASKI